MGKIGNVKSPKERIDLVLFLIRKYCFHCYFCCISEWLLFSKANAEIH